MRGLSGSFLVRFFNIHDTALVWLHSVMSVHGVAPSCGYALWRRSIVPIRGIYPWRRFLASHRGGRLRIVASLCHFVVLLVFSVLVNMTYALNRTYRSLFCTQPTYHS